MLLVFFRLPDYVHSGLEVARRLFLEHNIYIKHCGGKSLSFAERYIRVASRTQLENLRFVKALKQVLGSEEMKIGPGLL